MKFFVKIGIVLCFAITFSFNVVAQNPCADFLKLRKTSDGFRASSMSKSGRCFSGKSYKFLFPILPGNIYRITFYASAAFNREIHFRIIEPTTGKVFVDANGDSDPNDPNKPGALGEMEEDGKFIHTYYEFEPQPATTLQVVIYVKKSDTSRPIEGCIGIFLQEKPAPPSDWD